MITIPTPAELGLPEKFTHFREIQKEALRWLLTRTNRVKALLMPTGSGKSLTYVAYSILKEQLTGVVSPTCFVTDSRALQDQLMEDFGPMGMVDLRGRRNYKCTLREDYTCEEGFQGGCPFKGTIACEASAAQMRAATSKWVVTNYDKWTSAKKFGQGMEHFKGVVFDEGHESYNALGRAMQVFLGHNERTKDIHMDPPANPDQMEAWRVWAAEARALIEGDLQKAKEAIRNVTNPPPGKVRRALHLTNLFRRLGTLAVCSPKNWIVEEAEKGFTFDPIQPGRFAESALLLRVPDVLVISATLRPKTLFMIGQPKDSFDFREFNSEFDPRRNPIFYIPTMRVDSRAEDFSMLWLRLDQIAGRRQDRKGIVHTISYARRDDILLRSRFHSRMLFNERGEAPTPLIEEFKQSGDGSILVSPSVGQGHDFPGPTCEWQFIAKVPFPPPSKILKARTESDKEYPYYLAMQKLVQICGRGMRFDGDQCENFIPDDHADWFLGRYGHLAPQSFKTFFRRVSVLPQPPERLPR